MKTGRKFFAASFIFLFLSLDLWPLVGIAAVADQASSSPDVASADLSNQSTSTPAESPEQAARQELEMKIKIRNQELDSIKNAIAQTENALQSTQQEKGTLQRDLKILQLRKDELAKGIQADEINLNKLGLEMQSITFDIQDINGSILDKKQAIAKIIKEIQRNDNRSTLSILLTDKTLADGIMEAQQLNNLSDSLGADIVNLTQLHAQLSGKLGDIASRQEQMKVENQNLKYRRLILADQETQRKALLAQTKDQESIYQRHLSQILERQKEITSEMEALDAQLRGKIVTSELPVTGKIFIAPVNGGAITQGYGATSFAKNGYVGHWHNGVDFRASIGTPVLAAAGGQILYTGDQDKYCPKGAYGRFIVISHPNNLTTLYGHLSRVAVSPGQSVSQGDIIGYSGSTGYATGPHLHFTVYAGNTFEMRQSKYCGPMPQGGDLNPLKYL